MSAVPSTSVRAAAAPLADLLQQADAWRRGAQWQSARQAYGQAQQAAPRDPVLAHNLALCHLALGEPEQALRQARHALALAPDQWLSALLAAKALAALGRRDDALPVLEGLHARLPGQADVRWSWPGCACTTRAIWCGCARCWRRSRTTPRTARRPL